MPRKRFSGETPVKLDDTITEMSPSLNENKNVMCHSDKSLQSAPLSAGNYLHKKFKKVATANDCPDVAVPAPVLSTDEYSVEGVWRHKCPYCKTVCTKPSALAKHLQVHSDERPFPCETCGFAFKTKSNLSKHCKSQSHTERLAKEEPEEAKPKIYKPKFRTASIYTKLEEDRLKDLESAVITETVLVSHKQEEDSSQPLNLSLATITKCQDKFSPIEKSPSELKGVYKLLLNQIIKCNGNKEQPFCEMCGLKFNSQEDLVRHICDQKPNGIKFPEPKTVSIPFPSPGPLLGRTPLVEFHRPKESEILAKPVIIRNLEQQQEMLAIFQGGQAIPFVPGMPGPHTAMSRQLRQQYEPKQTEAPPSKKPKLEEFIISTSPHKVIIYTNYKVLNKQYN